MISFFKLVIFVVHFSLIYNIVLGRAMGESYTTAWCEKQIEPANPRMQCRYGFFINGCNKTTCYLGPDHDCREELQPSDGRCAPGLRCCGICTGCYNEFDCSERHCDFSSNTLKAKKTITNPLWFFDDYQRNDEQSRFQELQQQQLQQQQQKQKAEKQRSISHVNSINLKPLILLRPDNYPINMNSLEYVIAREN